MTDLTLYSDEERRTSVKDILNLGIVAHLEGDMADLPSSQDSAIQFQSENLSAAVRSLFCEYLSFLISYFIFHPLHDFIPVVVHWFHQQHYHDEFQWFHQ